jgi:glycosyltransferase involved in cell wall biosynthesis
LAAAVLTVGLIVEQCLAPVPGGTGRYSAELAAALAVTRPPDARLVSFTAWHRHLGPATVPGVDGPTRLALPRRLLGESWARGRGPRPRGVDLVHAPTLLVPPPTGAGLVVTIHDTVPWTHPQTLTRRGVAWHRRMAGRAARRAALVVVPTEAVRRELAGLFDLRWVEVVGEGVSRELALPADGAERAARLRLPPGGYLLTLATLEPRKGLDVAVAALAESSAPDLPLLIAGAPGWGSVAPAQLARRYGLSDDRVRLLGRLSDPDLAVVLSRATALLVPSRAEGFGLPALEAMSLGTPVVVSDVPALREVTGGAALVVPVADPAALAGAAGRLAGDPALRAALGEAGRKRAGGYSWQQAARRLWRLYRLVSPG